MAPVFIVLLVVIGGSGAALALRPVFGPLFAGLPVLGPLFRLPVLGVRRTYIVDPNLGGRGLMFVAVAAAVVTLAGAVLVHRAAPILSGEEGGVASMTTDGKFALVNHGRIVRELTFAEYQRLRASGFASMVTVGNILLVAFLLSIVGSLAFVRRRSVTVLRRPMM
jgi:hypothetical protein